MPKVFTEQGSSGKPRVFIYPGDSYHSAIKMFEGRGFEVIKHHEGVDLICFLGGTDVNPAMYGEKRGPYTQAPDWNRDYIEQMAFKTFSGAGIPMVGICRGGQLLNVLNGGRMIQHLGETISGDVKDDEGRVMRVDHHQGMLYKGQEEEVDDPSVELLSYLIRKNEPWPDYAIYYKDTKSLCFQPHPEWGHEGTEDYFFELIEEHLGLKGI